MTRVVIDEHGKRTIFIETEPDGTCELCNQVAELRPYGPNGERICYDCGMKNPESTKQIMLKTLLGETH